MDNSTRKRIVIIGGGFGGLYAALWRVQTGAHADELAR